MAERFAERFARARFEREGEPLAEELAAALTRRLRAAADPDAEMATTVEELNRGGHRLTPWSEGEAEHRGQPLPVEHAAQLAIGWARSEESGLPEALVGWEPTAPCPRCGAPLFPHDAITVEIAASSVPVKVTLRLPHRTRSVLEIGAKADRFELPVHSCARCGGIFLPATEPQRG